VGSPRGCAAGFQPAACPPPGRRVSPTSSRQGPGQTRNRRKPPKPCGLEIRDTADWKSAVQWVPQVSNRLCRRLPVGRALDKPETFGKPPNLADWKSAIQQTGSLRYMACRRFPTCCVADFQSAGSGLVPGGRIKGKSCGLEIRDTADWKSAVQWVPQVSNLLYRRLPVGRTLGKPETFGKPPNLADWKPAIQQTLTPNGARSV